MPNTLAHLGAQGLATRPLIRAADPKWVYAGCVVPDLPWILQRAAHAVAPGLDPYALRLYATAQSSLAVSLLLCAALAAFSALPRRIFAVLALNSLLHLVLDACETKWANGVHLFAPFSWELLNFGFFWPESLPTYLITALGPIVFAYAWWRRPGKPVGLSFEANRRTLAGAVLLAAYFAAPLALLSGPARADNHSVRTLRERAERPGRPVAFDRNQYVDHEGGDLLVSFAGEELSVQGTTLDRSAVVSARGAFLDEDPVLVRELHDHAGWPREILSYAGLTLVAASWLRPRRRREDDPGPPALR
jgi:hypothetical protein